MRHLFKFNVQESILIKLQISIKTKYNNPSLIMSNLVVAYYGGYKLCHDIAFFQNV